MPANDLPRVPAAAAVGEPSAEAIAAPTDIVRASALCKRVRTADSELTILEDVDLSIADGATVAIIGASGSGKTTLLGILAGLDTPTSGQVQLGRYELSALDEERRALVRGELVGFVFQSFQLLDSLTAIENVMLPVELKRGKGAAERARSLLAKVGLEHREQHYPRQLSGGEQQRVAIARAFATDPRVLFADEPTGNLDARTGERVIDLLFELNAEFRTTLVLVTHDQRLAERCGGQFEIAAGRRVR